MQKYPLKGGFKWGFVIFGLLTSIVLMGIPVLILGLKAYAATDDDGLEWWWLGKKRVAWTDITQVSRARAAGLVGGLMAPMSISRSSKKGFINFPSGCFQNRDQLMGEIAQRTGTEIP